MSLHPVPRIQGGNTKKGLCLIGMHTYTCMHHACLPSKDGPSPAHTRKKQKKWCMRDRYAYMYAPCMLTCQTWQSWPLPNMAVMAPSFWHMSQTNFHKTTNIIIYLTIIHTNIIIYLTIIHNNTYQTWPYPPSTCRLQTSTGRCLHLAPEGAP